MDLEQMQGMQPALYHRYGVLDDGDDDDDDEAGPSDGTPGDFGSTEYGTMLAAAMQNMDISGSGGAGEFEGGAVVVGDVVRERDVEGEPEGGSAQGTGGSWSLLARPGASARGVGRENE